MSVWSAVYCYSSFAQSTGVYLSINVPASWHWVVCFVVGTRRGTCGYKLHSQIITEVSLSIVVGLEGTPTYLCGRVVTCCFVIFSRFDSQSSQRDEICPFVTVMLQNVFLCTFTMLWKWLLVSSCMSVCLHGTIEFWRIDFHEISYLESAKVCQN